MLESWKVGCGELAGQRVGSASACEFRFIDFFVDITKKGESEEKSLRRGLILRVIIYII
jgi:hypothetical protein